MSVKALDARKIHWRSLFWRWQTSLSIVKYLNVICFAILLGALPNPLQAASKAVDQLAAPSVPAIKPVLLAEANDPTLVHLLPTRGAAVAQLAVFDETMQQFMRERRIEAGTLAISRHGVVLFKRGYGWKDRTLQTSVQPDTLMRLASLDKILTAAAVKRLIAHGQLSATTKVFPFLHITPPPAQTPDAHLNAITVQHLLDQRTGPSGLSDDNIIQMFDAAADSVTEWPTTASCNALAFDEASLNRAIDCVNAAGAGTHTISVTHDISFTQPSPLLTNPDAKQVVIEGNGHTIDAQGHGRVLTIKLTRVVIRQLTLRGGRFPLDGTRDDNGGGIQLAASFRDGGCGLTLLDSVVEDNEAPNGGGIANLCDSSGITITNSIIRNNHATLGGGIYIPTGEELFSEMVMVDSQVINNRAETQGGGIFLRAGDSGTNATISNSTIAGNVVISGTGGGISVRTGNEAAVTNLTMHNVAITGNMANAGGGLHVESRGSTIVTVGNTTISGNQASSGNGGGVFIKGAIEFDSTNVRLINSTIVNNGATQGAGIYKLDGLLTIANTLVVSNTTSGDCQLDVSPGLPSRYVSGGHNLDSDGSCLPADVRQPTDIPSGDAHLGPLADNGGSTLTHALLPGSQAIDAGDDATCTAEPVNGVDQRGIARPQGAHCDSGAYEAAATPPPTSTVIFVSAKSSGQADDIKFRDEDILAYNPATNVWLMVFDGSDVGITKDVDAFAFLPDGSLLLSFNGATTVPGLGAVDDSDLVRFTPTVLGDTTAGTFTWYLRGSDVGLNTDSEDIDAIGLSADGGDLVLSTIGNFTVPLVSGRDEDLFRLNDATLGVPSAGRWSLFFDGSTVGLANEDINGLWLDPTKPDLYITVKDSFAFGSQHMDGNDIFMCTLSQAGACNYSLSWDADQHGYSAKHLDGMSIGALPPTFRSTLPANAAAQATDEDTATDDDSDDLDVEEGNLYIFLPLVGKGLTDK